MNPLIQWLQKEGLHIVKELFKFVNYYNLREKLLFYITLNYIMGKNSQNRIHKEISYTFITSAFLGGTVALIFLIIGIPCSVLTGFNWNYIAIIQYSLQILSITYIAWKTTKNINYSTTLAFTGAAATGYLYEFPFWFYSVKKAQAYLIHVSPKNIFFLSFQMISIGVFIWLIRKQVTKFNKKDLALFILVQGFSFLMASKMYVWQSMYFVRLPMMAYSLYLCKKMWISHEIQDDS